MSQQHKFKFFFNYKEAVNLLFFQLTVFQEDPYESFATNEDNFISQTSALSLKIIGQPNDSISYEVESKANITIKKDAEETIGVEGVLKQYLITSDIFIKVCRLNSMRMHKIRILESKENRSDWKEQRAP